MTDQERRARALVQERSARMAGTSREARLLYLYYSMTYSPAAGDGVGLRAWFFDPSDNQEHFIEVKIYD